MLDRFNVKEEAEAFITKKKTYPIDFNPWILVNTRSKWGPTEKAIKHLLVAFQIALDLVFHAFWHPVKSERQRARIRRLLDRNGERSFVFYVSKSSNSIRVIRGINAYLEATLDFEPTRFA